MDFIDIEEIKTKIWCRIYSEICGIIVSQNKKNEIIQLSSEINVYGVRLDSDNVLLFYRSIDDYDIAEEFDDQTLFDVYNSLFHKFSE